MADRASDGDTTSDGEVEPDYRMSLAAERTFLAYVRTSLALLAGGVAVVALPDAGHGNLRRATGVLLILVGLLVAGTGRTRWYQVDAAMRRRAPLPRSRIGTLSTVGVLAAGLLALVLVLLI